MTYLKLTYQTEKVWYACVYIFAFYAFLKIHDQIIYLLKVMNAQ